jgi:hypothetical protein
MTSQNIDLSSWDTRYSPTLLYQYLSYELEILWWRNWDHKHTQQTKLDSHAQAARGNERKLHYNRVAENNKWAQLSLYMFSGPLGAAQPQNAN